MRQESFGQGEAWANSTQNLETIQQSSSRLLSEITAWTKSEADISRIFCNYTGSRLKQARCQLNRDIIRVVMLVLAQGQAAEQSRAQTFSLRKLARALDELREESMQRTLRNWIMPLLTEAGWVDGFVETDSWSSTPHEIQITQKGLDAVMIYLRSISSNPHALA